MTNINLDTYEESLPNKVKKELGIFYTDSNLANYMIGKINIKPTDKILDPSCGSGIFIRNVEKILGENFQPSNIYGIDIDKNIINLLKDNLKEKYPESIINKNIIKGNGLGNRIPFLKFNNESDKFDVVIGNPPYVTGRAGDNYNPKLFEYKNYIATNVNLAMLMLIRALDLVKKDGIISFILPKNILHVNCYKELRRKILSQYTIQEIVDLKSYFKGVRGEQIILTIKNTYPNSNHKITIKHLIDKTPLEMSETKIYQHIYEEENVILLYKHEEEVNLINKLKNKGEKLSNIVNNKIFRGIAIIENNTDCIAYRGRDIKKFGTKSYIEASPKDIYNDKLKLLKNKKIIMQNIFSTESGVIASYVDENCITTETVTNIIYDDEKTLKYILGLINSKLLNYFLIIKVFNDSKLTMHTDRKYIGELPILINKEYFEKIINLVEAAMDNNYNKLTDITKEIDKIVYKIYEISNNEISIVETRMNEILSKEWI